MTETAWDRLLDLVDHLADNPHLPVAAEGERTFAALCTQAIADGSVDRELHADDTARWLAGLVIAYRAVREAHPDVPSDDDLGMLRVIITRWLHPARPGR
ncbi:hypothetical protein [Aeromicrobium sp.]|uniref:hypothetical protein n=1 Tax=Aeromicrobium sp. TaxID=1871063 RepID=UPI0030C41209